MYLALASLHRLANENGSGFLNDLAIFTKELEDIALQQQGKTSQLITDYQNASAEPEKRRQILLQLYELDRDNKKLLAYASFYGAMGSQWALALESAEQFLQTNGREDALRLSTSLLVPGILYHMGRENDGDDQLQKFRHQTNITWHKHICDTLLNQQSAESLFQEAGNAPEKILTAAVALGFQAEALGDNSLAMSYYREALGSYLDTWAEYGLAQKRYLNLRKK